MSAFAKLKKISGHRVSFEEVLRFAEFSMEDKEVISRIKHDLEEGEGKTDESSEELEMFFLSKANEYAKLNGFSWRYRSGLKEAFRVLLAVVAGHIDSVRDERARDILIDSKFIEFGEV